MRSWYSVYFYKKVKKWKDSSLLDKSLYSWAHIRIILYEFLRKTGLSWYVFQVKHKQDLGIWLGECDY